MKKIIFLALILFLFVRLEANALTFKEALNQLKKHESIEFLRSQSKSFLEEAHQKGSWGDPTFKIVAKNFPKDTLSKNQTPMTGVEFEVSQKIALTTKYKNIKKAFYSLFQAIKYEAKDKEKQLAKALWEIVIIRRKTSNEINILKENLIWISKILRVSKKLYSNGKISQQALLDIQIRKSEIESDLNNNSYELSQIDDHLNYLLDPHTQENQTHSLDYNTVPWNLLNQREKINQDYKELSLKQKLLSKEHQLKASKLNYMPDLTFSLSLTKRSSTIDEDGDFIGAKLSFPLPFSKAKYSSHRKATHEKYAAIQKLKNYKRLKTRDLSLLKKEISKLTDELNILTQKTLKFSKNSRFITSKSYGLGNSSYIELLQSELKLQKILLKKTRLEAKRDTKKIALRYLLGEPLHE